MSYFCKTCNYEYAELSVARWCCESKNHYSQDYGKFVARTFGDQGSDVMNLVHASLGISGEAGEIVDSIKKTWLYGKEIDKANLIEEVGDLLFYCQALCSIIGVSLDDAKASNIDKLLRRFPDGKFTKKHALQRLDKNERETHD